MTDFVPPEEKLLSLIRGQKKNKTVPAAAQNNIAPQPHPAASSKTPPRQPLYLTITNRVSKLGPAQIIRLFFILASIYLGAALIYPWIVHKKIELPQPKTSEIEKTEQPVVSESKPVESYLEGVRGKQIFGSAASGSAETRAAAAVDVAENLSLVGVVTGENPQAVIEDKKNQRTYYVTVGQTIGDMKVDSIEEGKIILDRMGEKFELHL